MWPKALQVRLRRSGTMCGGLMTIVRGDVMQKDAYVSHTPPKLEEEVRPNITEWLSTCKRSCVMGWLKSNGRIIYSEL